MRKVNDTRSNKGQTLFSQGQSSVAVKIQGGWSFEKYKSVISEQLKALKDLGRAILDLYNKHCDASFEDSPIKQKDAILPATFAVSASIRCCHNLLGKLVIIEALKLKLQDVINSSEVLTNNFLISIREPILQSMEKCETTFKSVEQYMRYVANNPDGDQHVLGQVVSENGYEELLAQLEAKIQQLSEYCDQCNQRANNNEGIGFSR